MKKTIALLLTLAMVFSILSVAVFAQEDQYEVEDGDQVDAADDSDYEDVAADDSEDLETPEETEVEVESEDESEVETEVEYESEVEDESADDSAAEEPAAEEVADEDTEGNVEPLLEVTEEEEDAAGITPDSRLYGLERAMERISLALTLGKSAKAKKGLAHALERKMELKAMMAKGDLDSAAEAEEAMAEDLEGVEEAVDEMESSDAEEELADVEEIQAEVEGLQEEVQEISKVALQVKGTLSEENQAKLDALVAGLEESTGKVSVKVQAKKNKTQVKVKIVEDREDGNGKKVTVSHETLSKKADDKKAVKAETQVKAEKPAKEPKADEEPKAAKAPKGKQ